MGALSEFLESAKDAMVSNVTEKFLDFDRGAATLDAYARGGLKDLQDAVTQAFPDSQRQNESLGMIASPTPQIITEELKGKDSQTIAQEPKAPEMEMEH